MKHAKKLASVLLALVMVFSLATTVFAASGTNDNTGKITINNAVKDKTYTIYQILELESFDTVAGTYSYKATTAWKSFVEGVTVAGIYLETDAQGYVTWKTGADEVEFAALAKDYAATLGTNQGQKNATYNVVEFTDLNLGYYLVDSTLGAICSLDTTNTEVTIKEKNAEPTLQKFVQEDSSGDWGNSNDATIGDTINYKVSIKVIDGQPKDYVMHDTMDAGLTFNNDVAVTVNGITSTNFTVDGSPADRHTFDVSFSGLNANDKIEVTYSAILNENAVIYGNTNDNTNDNTAHLSYKDTTDTTQTTTLQEVNTKTFYFDLVKTKEDKTVLTGAQFKLYDAETGGNEIALVEEATGVYRVATADEQAAEGFTAATIEAGKVVVEGLDTDTYYLEETKAPEGYNKLPARKEVKIQGNNLTATMNAGGDKYESGSVWVENKTGSLLPSTGGIGTTIFYILGSVLVLLAVVLLVTKKRMKVKE